jgi:hypothetical protein
LVAAVSVAVMAVTLRGAVIGGVAGTGAEKERASEEQEEEFPFRD